MTYVTVKSQWSYEVRTSLYKMIYAKLRSIAKVININIARFNNFI